jgi:serine O-acetyltransferase
MELVDTTRNGLVDYVTAQLNHFFPDGIGDTRAHVAAGIDDALDRIRPCVKLNRVWPKDRFSYLHSNQYAVLLYFLANTLWQRKAGDNICNKLYCLNKALNALECFYAIELPELFCICHSPGIVLAQATYANYFVLYQNSTVGRVEANERPIFSPGVVMFPNTAVIGNCRIGPRTFLAQGNSIIDADTPGNCVVFSNQGSLVFKKPRVDYLERFFRLDEASAPPLP